MFDDARTPDPTLPSEDGPSTSTPSDSIPVGANPDKQARVEVTCEGCRRGLRIRGDYLGRFVVCQHCGRKFVARADVERTAPDGAAEGGPTPWPSDPGRGVPGNGANGFEALAARIRRESRLQAPTHGPRPGNRPARPTSRPPASSEDRLKHERDSALAEVARLAAELDELRPRLSELEARRSTRPGVDDAAPPQDPGRGDLEAELREAASSREEMAARVGALEGELEAMRAGRDSDLAGHREAIENLERAHSGARDRWLEERADQDRAIERATLEARSSAESERDALRAELDRARAQAGAERDELLARLEQGLRSAEGAARRADELQRERDAWLARSEELEARLATQAGEAERESAEVERRHRDEVEALARDLERAGEREEEFRRRIAALEDRAGALQADLERERSQAGREDDRDARAARLSEELTEARGREDRDAARIAALEGRVAELLEALGRESEELEAEKRAHAGDLDAARQRADRERAGLEAEIAALRRRVDDAEKARDSERERAASLERGAGELAGRLAMVETVLASLKHLETETSRLSGELALSRQELAATSRHNALLLEQLGALRADWGARRLEESSPRPILDEPHAPPPTEDRGLEAVPVIEAAAHAEVMPEAPAPALEGEAGHRDPAPVEVAPGVEATRETRPPSGRPKGRDVEISIALRGVSKEYRRDKFRIPVLRDLDLTVEQGEFLALMGPSGSGKTTLLNLIAGLDQATAGSIVVHGRELAGLSEAQLTRWRANNVGFIFQMYNLVPVMTAVRNVELPLLLTRLSGRERRANAMTALRIVGLEGREHHYPRQLSGGQEQRVSIARAIVTDPHLIVADEPTGDLDRKSADEILNLLGSLNREFHKTIVMVTHDPQAAQRATRVLHLDKGQLVADSARPRLHHAGSPA